MSNVIKLINNGNVKIGEREFTRLLGGFGEDKALVTTKQISDIMGYELRVVNQTIDRNIKEFEDNIHIIDLKKIITDSDHLVNLGYSKVATGRSSSKFYGLSEAGFLLYLKFAEGDKAIELYKDFIEDYFKTKAENIVLKKTVEEELEFLKEQRAMTLGKMFMEFDNTKKMELFTQQEEFNQRINKLETSISNEKLLESVKIELSIADTFTNSTNCYDMGILSKIIDFKGMGRNNLFKYLRKHEILMGNNVPYGRYSEYFKVIPIDNDYTGKIDYKTLVKSKGIKFVFNKLVKDGYVSSKTFEQISKELTEE